MTLWIPSKEDIDRAYYRGEITWFWHQQFLKLLSEIQREG
jgi:hypothetical protein